MKNIIHKRLLYAGNIILFLTMQHVFSMDPAEQSRGKLRQYSEKQEWNEADMLAVEKCIQGMQAFDSGAACGSKARLERERESLLKEKKESENKEKCKKAEEEHKKLEEQTRKKQEKLENAKKEAEEQHTREEARKQQEEQQARAKLAAEQKAKEEELKKAHEAQLRTEVARLQASELQMQQELNKQQSKIRELEHQLKSKDLEINFQKCLACTQEPQMTALKAQVEALTAQVEHAGGDLKAADALAKLLSELQGLKTQNAELLQQLIKHVLETTQNTTKLQNQNRQLRVELVKERTQRSEETLKWLRHFGSRPVTGGGKSDMAITQPRLVAAH